MTHQYLWLALSAVTASIPFIMIKKYNDTNNEMYILLAAFAYALLIITYIKILRTHEMIKVYPLLKIISLLIVVFVGILFFNNKMTGKIILGIVLAIIALYLLC